ncbi:MAG: hypothetical protein FRX48_02119 [Lasallia pustulata]|uniref:Uncharacterized protein n=1 Tax=Lasallia pustulata TaxID=136370 RepID=A0A5M8PYE7_9LECA|nr:MAG: hypothetical protein FRX48_02119 [Lasallia pustulata]
MDDRSNQPEGSHNESTISPSEENPGSSTLELLTDVNPPETPVDKISRAVKDENEEAERKYSYLRTRTPRRRIGENFRRRLELAIKPGPNQCDWRINAVIGYEVINMCAALITIFDINDKLPEHIQTPALRPNNEANEKPDERADEGSDDEGDLGRTIYRLIRIIQVIHNEQIDRLDKSQETFG